MKDASQGATPSRLVTPQAFTEALSRPPILSTVTRHQQDFAVQRFMMPSLAINVGGACMHRLSLNLADPVLIEHPHDGTPEANWDKEASNLIPAEHAVDRNFVGEVDFMVVHLAPAIVEEVAADFFGEDKRHFELVEQLARDDRMIDRLGHLLLSEIEAGASSSKLFMDTLIRALGVHLLRSFSAEAPRQLEPVGAMVTWRLRRALDYMHAYLADNPSIRDLAAAANCSPSHFARSFRLATGIPPHRYMLRLRLQRARHLLEHSRLSIIEIGLACGFEQATHFATTFRAATGMTPRAYRTMRSTV